VNNTSIIGESFVSGLTFFFLFSSKIRVDKRKRKRKTKIELNKIEKIKIDDGRC